MRSMTSLRRFVYCGHSCSRSGSQARLAEGLNGFANLTPEECEPSIRDYLEADTSQLLSETERTAVARRFAVPDEHGGCVCSAHG